MSTTINLKDFYPWYTQDELIEVSDEVVEELLANKRTEKIHEQRIRRNKSYYSLDVGDGIEKSAIVNSPNDPETALAIKERCCRVCRALNSLPEIQGRRIEAHFIHGKSQPSIARAEGVTRAAVNLTILKGLSAMKKYLKNQAEPLDNCLQSEAGL